MKDNIIYNINVGKLIDLLIHKVYVHEVDFINIHFDTENNRIKIARAEEKTWLPDKFSIDDLI